MGDRPDFDKDFANFNPTHGPSYDDDPDRAAIRKLAELTLLEYERARKEAAEKLGCRPTILDVAVKWERDRGKPADTKGQGRPVEFKAIKPWPNPVHGAALLRALSRYFSLHLVLPPRAHHAIALWAVHCHCFHVFSWTPRLQVKAPTKNAGKSTVISLLRPVVPRAQETESTSEAALFRVVEQAQPTLLMDEADSYVRDNPDVQRMVKAGTMPNGTALRCVGDSQEVRQFACHAPMALAGIGSLPDPIESRSIKILMRRRLRNEPLRPMDKLTQTMGERLARKAARWVQDHLGELREARPNMGHLINRAADNWRPLFAIADLAGGDWPTLVRAAERVVGTADDDNAESLGERLLADVRDAFNAWVGEHPNAVDHEMASAELIRRLVDRDDRPWAEMGKSRKPLTTNALARMLGKLGVHPRKLGPDHDRFRGYRLLDFADAFDRYLPDGG